MNRKIRAAILGPGNIGIDLMMKVLRSKNLELVLVSGIEKESLGLQMAKERGIDDTHLGIDGILERKDDIDLVFDCTSAYSHLKHAPLLKEAGIFAVDLTPAGVGPVVVPSINLDKALSEANNVNMITCGAQACVPLAYAVQRVTPVEYAEMVTGASAAAVGPSGRSNTNEFKKTSKRALLEVAGVKTAKVINIINPAKPPAIMRNTVYAVCDLSKFEEICDSVDDMVKTVQQYVPGYRLKIRPQVVGDHVVIINEVESAGDYFPKYAGNLDIITAAAVRVAEVYAEKRLGGK